MLRGAVGHGARRRAIVVELLGKELLLRAEALVVQGGNLLLVVGGFVEVCRGRRRDAVGAIAKFVVVLVLGNATRFGQVEDELLAAVGGGLGALLAGLLGRRHVLLGVSWRLSWCGAALLVAGVLGERLCRVSNE